MTIKNQEVTWSSNNEAVASVDASGLVTLKAAGSVEIMATSVANKEVSSSPAHITVYEAGSKTLEVASLPTKVKYKVGEKVSYEGISIMAYSFVDGVKDSLMELKIQQVEKRLLQAMYLSQFLKEQSLKKKALKL